MALDGVKSRGPEEQMKDKEVEGKKHRKGRLKLKVSKGLKEHQEP